MTNGYFIYVFHIVGDFMEQTYVASGTLENGRLIHLDEPLPIALTTHRVRITLSPLLPEQRNGKTLIEWVRKARADLKNKGFHFRTKEEIDQQIREEREAWGE